MNIFIKNFLITLITFDQKSRLNINAFQARQNGKLKSNFSLAKLMVGVILAKGEHKSMLSGPFGCGWDVGWPELYELEAYDFILFIFLNT